MRYHAPLTVRIPRLVAVLLLSVPFAILAGGVQAGSNPESPSQISALVLSVPSPPRWFTGSDDQIHLVHELWLTNPLPAPVTVTLASCICRRLNTRG